MDVLYEHNIRLFCSSEGLPFELFQHIMTRSQANEPKVMQVGQLMPAAPSESLCRSSGDMGSSEPC